MNKKTIYLHIGFEKTGSKAIQNFCAEHSSWLHDEGVHYLNDEHHNLVFANTHWPLVTAFSNSKAFVPPAKQLTLLEATELVLETVNNTPCSKIIFSAEPFSSVILSEENILTIKESLSDFEVKIIAYVRRQDNFFISHISTYVKGGFTVSLSEKITMSETVISYDNINRYDYQLMLSRWENVFGINSIIVRPFETVSLVNGDIVADFLDVLGVKFKKKLETATKGNSFFSFMAFFLKALKGKPEKVSETAIRANKSLSIEALLFLSLINKVASPAFTNGYLRDVVNNIQTFPTKRRGQQLISNSHRQEIIDKFEERNDFVAKRYLHKRSKLFLEELPEVDEPWLSVVPLSHNELVEIVKYLDNAVPGVAARIISALCKNTSESYLKAQAEMFPAT